MIRALCSLLALLATQSCAQTTLVSDFVSPCPNVFSYDPLATGNNRWYGTVTLTSDTPLYELWLNIVLENKANILGNWLGEVTTNDNKDFKIENENVMIVPGKPLSVPFFVQYNDSLAPPKLKAIRFNGKEICHVKPQGEGRDVQPLRVAFDFKDERPEVTTSTTMSPTIKTTLSASNWHQTEAQTTENTLRSQQTQYWQRTDPAPSTQATEVQSQTTVNALNWFYTQADNNQQASATVQPPNQRRTGNTSPTATANNFVSGSTTDGTRTSNPVWLSAAPNQNSKEPRPNDFQIEVTQVGNTKYWSKIPENTTRAAAMVPSGTENVSSGWPGNEQRVRPQNSYQPWAEPARNGMGIQSGVDSSRYPTNDGRAKSVDGSSSSFNTFQTTSGAPVPTPNRNIDHSKQAEGYVGGLPVIYIPNFGPQNLGEPTCGKVMLNKGINQNLQTTTTLEGQWPWLTALYQQQNSVELHYKYVCGGTLVSRRNLITAAHCVARKNSASPVNMDTLLVFMGKHNLRTTVEGVDLKFVYKILIYPEYDPTNYKTDLAILTLREPVTFSNKIQPICLWPEQEIDLQNVVGETGSTVGWGYEVTGTPREDQILLQMEVIAQQTCVLTYANFFNFDPDKTFCAAYRNSGGTCNGDSGGGMVFQKGGSWYLRGIVSLSVARPGMFHCDANHHVFFTDVAKFLPWIQTNIEHL